MVARKAPELAAQVRSREGNLPATPAALPLPLPGRSLHERGQGGPGTRS